MNPATCTAPIVGARGRYITFQMAEVAVSRQMFDEMLSVISRSQATPAPA